MKTEVKILISSHPQGQRGRPIFNFCHPFCVTSKGPPMNFCL